MKNDRQRPVRPTYSNPCRQLVFDMAVHDVELGGDTVDVQRCDHQLASDVLNHVGAVAKGRRIRVLHNRHQASLAEEFELAHGTGFQLAQSFAKGHMYAAKELIDRLSKTVDRVVANHKRSGT